MQTGWTSDRVVAVVRLVVTLVAMVAGGAGIAVEPDGLATIVACGVALVAGVWSWWKNNNVTKAAQDAQAYLDGIRGTRNV